MKKTTVLLFVMFMTIQGEVSENRITGFPPDSLNTWQINFNQSFDFSARNYDNYSKSYLSNSNDLNN